MRRTVIAALAAAPLLALAGPGTAAAADFPADVNVWVEGSTIRGTMSLPPLEEVGEDWWMNYKFCNGPWIHTQASADRISATYDLDADPEYWFIRQPDSPHGTQSLTTDQLLRPTTSIDSGMSGETAMYLVPDGHYVAGVGCGQYTEDGRDFEFTSLKLIPITVGTPSDSGAGGDNGSSPFDFGSTGS